MRSSRPHWYRVPGLWAVIVVVAACQGRQGVALTVNLRTDFQPLREFIGVRIVVSDAVVSDNQSQERSAKVDGAYIDPGVPLAEFEGLSANDARVVTVALLKADRSTLKETRIAIAHTRDTILTVGVTRDCADVTCPDVDGQAQRCLGGRCVDARCHAGQEAFCVSTECVDDSECTTASPCAFPRCVEGICYDDAAASTVCASDEVCDVALGCVPAPTSCDTPDDCDRRTLCVPAECIESLCIYRLAPEGNPCFEGSCSAGVCVPDATCEDGLLNQGESDVDCGGGVCDACELGARCSNDQDCASMVCDTVGDMRCEAPDTCGNGRIDGSDVCDDGNMVTGDGCSALCLKENGEMCTMSNECQSGVCDLLDSMQCEPNLACGNGVPDAGEACEDGNTTPGDGCDAFCLKENGIDCTADAQCQSGVCNLIGSNQCEPANVCGNGKRDAGEICDDGNVIDNDGCDASCKLSLGEACTASAQCDSGACDRLESNTCEPANVCGNGVIDAGEGCEDGATVAGDGCGPTCLLETGEPCTASALCESNFCVNVCYDDNPEYVKASNTNGNDEFGSAVALSGDLFAVGAGREASCENGINPSGTNNGCAAAGAVYVYKRTGGVWAFDAYIKASNSEANDWFGDAIALDGNTLVVGARGEDSCADGVGGSQTDNGCGTAGAAYVFVRNAGVWTQQAYVKASNSSAGVKRSGSFAGDWFGWAVDIQGDTLVVSAPFEDSCATGIGGNESDDTCVDAGAAYIFKRAGSTWTQAAYVKASNTDSRDEFGQAVAVYGDTVAVGSSEEESCVTGTPSGPSSNVCYNSGAVYVFRDTGSWAEEAFLKRASNSSNTRFGSSLGMAADSLAVGVTGDGNCGTGVGSMAGGGCATSGAVHMYARSGTTWSQEAYIKATNTEAGDAFGTKLDLDGNRLIVNAWKEASCSKVPNSLEADNGCANAGAAYIYTKVANAWTAHVYLKAPNTEPTDWFGEDVAISSDTVAAGVVFDSGCGTNLTGDYDDNSCFRSGAAFAWDIYD